MKKYFLKLINKSGDQKPLKKKGVIPKSLFIRKNKIKNMSKIYNRAYSGDAIGRVEGGGEMSAGAALLLLF
jgi:hypothetical protein